jgi:hypothetical protein
MRTFASIVLVGALAAFVGCNKTDTGGPGKSTPPSLTEKVTGQKGTFDLVAPSKATVKQGEKAEFEVTIKRHDFNDTVTLSFPEVPKGLKVDFKDKEIKDPATSAKGWVEVDKDANPGESVIKVVAKPEKGDEAHVDFKLEVKAK